MRSFISLGLIIVIVLIGSTFAEDPVYIPDSVLKAAIENALGGISDPTPSDMLNLISFDGDELDIKDLTGLEEAKNLEELSLRCYGIWSISPLAGLTSLRHLDINNNKISDLSPLSGLNNLTYLDVHDNRVNSISSLNGMVNLSKLIIYRNNIHSISVCTGLISLEYIELYGNAISDLSPLVGLSSLYYVNCIDNPLSDDTCETVIPQLEANGVQVVCNSCEKLMLTITSTTGGSVWPSEGEYSYSYGHNVSMTAIADSGYTFLGWSGSINTSKNPLNIQMDHDKKIHANFVSMLDILYVDDNATNDPGPTDATISDPCENGTRVHPFDSIQEAIDVAAEGATIYVQSGTYRESITFRGRNIQLIGAEPNIPTDSDEGSYQTLPIIDGNEISKVVTFDKNENQSCVLKNFIITGGQGLRVGGLSCFYSSPTISNCIFVGNRSILPNGSTIYCSNSDAVFTHCTISGNSGIDDSTGIHLVDSNVVITNCILWDNQVYEMILDEDSEPLITYSNIKGGSTIPRKGNSTSAGQARQVNMLQAGNGNIDADPLFASPGYWADVQDVNTVAAAGDIDAIWMAGDYHLQSPSGRWDPLTRQWLFDDVSSPCINAGDPTCSVDDEPIPNGGIINMGAYGGTMEASKNE